MLMMDSYIVRVGLSVAIDLALLLPFILLAFIASRRGKAAVMPVLLFVVLFAMDVALIWSLKLYMFIPAWGGYNWQGKVLEAAWPILLALLVPVAFPPKQIGLNLPEQPRRWLSLPIACALYVVVGVPLVMWIAGAHLGVGGALPTFAYEATMPGLGEELAYRGVMLMLLNEAFGRPWKFAGIQFGWGFVIVTAMFGFIHGVDIEPGHPQVINIHFLGMIFPALTGAVLAWLRERTGSVWPGVLFHNFVNVVNQFLV